jgi:hypothetical protein
MNFIKKNYANILLLIILTAGAWMRAISYGDLRLSVANAETGSYIRASKASVLSWKIFAGQRLFTTNLIYKMANDESACPVTVYSTPATGNTVHRGIQPCFDRIALLQNIIAIFGWCLLAWTVAKFLKSPAIKIAAATSIMLFGFTPQIAEWDSMLSPESLSLSLFAIVLALMMEFTFRLAPSDPPFASKPDTSLLIGLLVVFLLWVFVRDVHLYAIPITLGLLGLLFFIKKFRTTKHVAIAFSVLLAFFIIGFISARYSLRATRYPIMNSLEAYILPHPSRVEFFKKYSMPEKDAPDYKDAPIYQAWADKHASKAYGFFLITHPGFVVLTLWEDFDQIRGDFLQPYFYTDDIKHRNDLVKIGEIFHPESAAVYAGGFMLVIALLAHAIQSKTPSAAAWAWLGLWAFGVSLATFLLSYFGDTAGLRRHIMPSVEMFRLFIWVFITPFLDQFAAQTE